MSSAVSRTTSSQPRAWVLVALALGFAMHVVWTPVHLAVAHQFEEALAAVGSQPANAAQVPTHIHGHGHNHSDQRRSGEQHEQHEHPGHDDRAGDHLISLLAVRALASCGPLQMLPLEDLARVFRAPSGRVVAGPLAMLAPPRPPPRPRTRGPPRAL